MVDLRTGLLGTRTALLPGQIVPRAKPLGEVIGEVSPFPGIANAPGSRRNRQHGSPVRPTVNRHSKSVPGTVGVTRKVELDHFGKLRSRLELLLLSHSFNRRQIRGGRRRTFTGRRTSRGSRRTFRRRRIVGFGLRRMAAGDARRSSEDMLRQRDFVLIAVVVFCHLRIPSIGQLGSSTISSTFSSSRSALRHCLQNSGQLNPACSGS